MKYLLDSNICIYFLRNNAGVIKKFIEAGLDNCYISEYTVAELFYGAECSDRPKENSQDIIEFCSALNVIPITNTIREFARQKALLRKKGTMIEDADIFIGSTAIVENMTMVTENVKHLSRLENIKIENWLK